MRAQCQPSIWSYWKFGSVHGKTFLTDIHAREWIANAVATYQIKELLENDAVDSTYLDNINIYILPMANPDGYEYSRNTVSVFKQWTQKYISFHYIAFQERLWRKNRADNAGAPNCKGVDLNRNWPFHYGGEHIQ